MLSGIERKRLIARNALMGATLGLGVGIWEARVIFFLPLRSTLLASEGSWVIWFLAPLVNLAFFGLVGVGLGWVAGIGKAPSAQRAAALTALMLGLGTAHMAWALQLAHTWVGTLEAIYDVSTPAAWCGIGAAVSLGLMRLLWGRIGRVFEPRVSWPLRSWSRVLCAAAIVLFCGIVAFVGVPQGTPAGARAGTLREAIRPNIVLITLDAARADHFSSYGYGRPTTPNLDRLSKQGVLFENALAPSSWTLPSHASMLTGLLPHQHGASAATPVDPGVWTLAEILARNGYTTGGFNGNMLYGEAGWGLGAGFQAYGDYRSSVAYNLSLTVLGRAVLQPTYQKLFRYDLLSQRHASDINQNVFSWLRRLPKSAPFFIFVHYFEVHDPYLPPPPFNRRFGLAPDTLVRRVSFGRGLQPPRPITREEHEQIVAAYDNALAYCDEQVGQLMQFLARTPQWSNTIVILTSDHGEAFGEHGIYGHGRGLHRELLHVPLIISGPSIPAGMRVSHLVRIREIFPTILDFAIGEIHPFRRTTLRRYWTPGFTPESFDDAVVSELTLGQPPAPEPPSISVVTAKWHMLHDARGRAELYDWQNDPAEKVNLAASAEYQRTVEELYGLLWKLIGDSYRPWHQPEYLFALDRPGRSFLRAMAFDSGRGFSFSRGEPRIGMAQAVFGPDTSHATHRTSPSEEELLRSLPYH